MGCWALAGDMTWGPQDEADGISGIHAALDAGINFIDTANIYSAGESEVIVGKAIRDRREEVVLATKVFNPVKREENLREINTDERSLSAYKIRKHAEGSLKRLGTDYIDLYQTHWPDHDMPYEHTLEPLTELIEEGKIADIVATDENPLENINTLEQVRFVMKEGIVYKDE